MLVVVEGHTVSNVCFNENGYKLGLGSHERGHTRDTRTFQEP